MTDDELLKALIDDKILQCKNDCVITNTRFLDLRQQGIFLAYKKDSEVVPVLFGGYGESERKIGLLIPKLYGVKTEDEFLAYNGGEPLKALRVEKDKFSTLSHRDYLGAIMNLGIKREMVGDILTDDKGASLVAFKEVVPHITKNLDRIGRGTCRCEEVPLSSLEKAEVCTQEIFATVASLRLDNIVSTAFSISRKLACEGIEQKKVYVDGIECDKTDKRVEVGSKIVFRGKGKVVLQEQNGLSKRDRPKIIIKKYI